MGLPTQRLLLSQVAMLYSLSTIELASYLCQQSSIWLSDYGEYYHCNASSNTRVESKKKNKLIICHHNYLLTTAFCSLLTCNETMGNAYFQSKQVVAGGQPDLQTTVGLGGLNCEIGCWWCWCGSCTA